MRKLENALFRVSKRLGVRKIKQVELHVVCIGAMNIRSIHVEEMNVSEEAPIRRRERHILLPCGLIGCGLTRG